jgi:hypothetical protein
MGLYGEGINEIQYGDTMGSREYDQRPHQILVLFWSPSGEKEISVLYPGLAQL